MSQCCVLVSIAIAPASITAVGDQVGWRPGGRHRREPDEVGEHDADRALVGAQREYLAARGAIILGGGAGAPEMNSAEASL
jgi:hypothetical protein